MEIERGVFGTIPYAAVGSGAPVVVAAGLWTDTGVASDSFVHSSLTMLRRLAGRRRLIVLNRRPHLPDDLTMAMLAAEYADAIRAAGVAPVDLVGTSTGGSIAQQVAADHPDTVRRLVLVSSACRLGSVGRQAQYAVAADLRRGMTRPAMGSAVASLAPPGLRTLARGVGWVAAGRLVSDDAAADMAVTIEAEDGFDLAESTRTISAPTLILAGGRDRFYSPELFAETAALIPRSRLRLFPRRGHISVTMDRQAQAALDAFLD